MTRRSLLSRLGLSAAALLVAAQLVPVDRSNPPVESEMPTPAAVSEILRRSCYDCHSNETVWPWYAWVAPASWLVSWDVREGRDELNFSTWNRLDAADRLHALEEMGEEVESGRMPLPVYLPLHPDATLTAADNATLLGWQRDATAR